MQEKQNIPAWGRWLLIVSTAVIVVALIVALLMTYANVGRATEALIRGQSVGLQASLRSDFNELASVPTQEDLQYILEDHKNEGLRYLALYFPNGGVLRAGRSHKSEDELVASMRRLKPGQPHPYAGRVLVLSRVRTNRTLHSPSLRRKRRSKRPRVLIEFAPIESETLLSSSQLSLAIGGTASVLLVVLAILLLRWFSRWDRMTRQAEHKRRLESLGQMSAVLAHEIRNPLASLKGNAQILQMLAKKSEQEDRPESKKIAAKATLVVSESKRLEDLVNDLLDFAKTGSLHKESCDPLALLHSCVADNQELEIVSTQAPKTWRLDRSRMQQVLRNILSNASQVSDTASATITVEDHALVFRIRDYGPGISENPEQLFTPFFTKRSKGTGLGLAVSKRLVELHGGTIEAQNADGSGAEFTIRIPKG